MSYETISNRLRDILQRIDQVYNVHTYFRDIPGEADFESAFKIDVDDGSLLSAWMMTRTGVTSKRPTFDDTILDNTHTIEVQGFYGLNDEAESERKFQEIIDNIYDTFKDKFLLEDQAGTALANIITTAPPQMLEIGHGQFSNYFVHFCRMVLSVEERVQ